jgi:hypothetical protein
MALKLLRTALLGHFTVNPEIQPGAQRLHEIRTQLVEQKATCVFAEPQFNQRSLKLSREGHPFEWERWIRSVRISNWVKQLFSVFEPISFQYASLKGD